MDQNIFGELTVLSSIPVVSGAQTLILALVKSSSAAVFIYNIESLKSIAFQNAIKIAPDLDYRIETSATNVRLTIQNYHFVSLITKQFQSFISILETVKNEDNSDTLWLNRYIKERFIKKSLTFLNYPQLENPFIQSNLCMATTKVKKIKKAYLAKELRKNYKSVTEYSNFKIFCGTWNVAGEPAAESLKPWLYDGQVNSPELYVLGFQEVDLSTEAYLMYDPLKEQEWSAAVERALILHREKYVKIASKQLVGMLILVYAPVKNVGIIQDVSAESIATGILGVMGNKGAVGVRLRILDSYYSFVNCHLAADANMTEKRNQDYQYIAKKLVYPIQSRFEDSVDYQQQNPWVATFLDTSPLLNGQTVVENTPLLTGTASKMLSIFETDHLVWMGDLNYRINNNEAKVKELISNKNLETLLNDDQLNIERNAKRVFTGFEEAPIAFNPTYKYDFGTNVYDTRILWLNNPLHLDDPDWIKCTSYISCDQIKLSDHKPVAATFDTKIRKINHAKVDALTFEITRVMDKLENEAIPTLALGTTQLDYGTISPLTAVTRTFSFKNIGQVIAPFALIPKNTQESLLKPWCKVSPLKGAVFPGEETEISVTICVTAEQSHLLNIGKESLSDIIIFHIENGNDHFISLNAEWKTSFIGESLDLLCRLLKPCNSYTVEKLQSLLQLPVNSVFNIDTLEQALKGVNPLDIQSHNSTPPSEVDGQGLSLPKEVWHIIDFIYKYGIDVDDLFFGEGDDLIVQHMIQCLDQGTAFDRELLFVDLNDSREFHLTNAQDLLQLELDTCKADVISKSRALAVHSAVQLLVKVLKSFPVPIIPAELQDRCTDGHISYSEAKRVIETKLFMPIFFRQNTNATPVDTQSISTYLYSGFASYVYGKPKEEVDTVETIARKREKFISHFLSI
ncbi:hypothetical protein HDV06_005519 [Boothiomyces sp. JEL0866]|nr:hypothetical protein HDV06_005519 [Boothiomyces sp. JEL0866]